MLKGGIRMTHFLGLAALSLFACDQTETPETTEPEVVEVQAVPACEDQDFALQEPSAETAWTPLAVQLVSEEVAENIFAIYDSNASAYGPQGFPLATSGGFVIGEDGVLVVETMINRQLFCQMVDLVRAETDLPILYAINTSYHGDHSYGNAFLPEDTLVVQHARTASFIQVHFEEDVIFMETNFGADQGIDEVTAVEADILVEDSGWSVDLGGVTVEAQYHGFAQTEGDLFVSVPEAKVIWTGNPLIAEAPAIPWLLDGHAHEVSETLAAVQASLPPDAVVIPGHGQPLKPDDFTFSVDYLDTLVAQVQGQVDAGADVEATQAEVTMVDYQGYALWDWVHTWVNVPNTHSELSP
jgi:glyoxylase-like metal-dependent hydrolase (beta-lactamase superfamily II)